MSKTQSGGGAGMFTALKNIAAKILESGKTRLELLGNEIELEKMRAIRLMLFGQGMVFCFGVAALLLIALLTIVFWDNRLLFLGVMSFLFVFVGCIFLARFKRATQKPEHVFATSLAELQEDIRQLKAAIDDDQAR